MEPGIFIFGKYQKWGEVMYILPESHIFTDVYSNLYAQEIYQTDSPDSQSGGTYIDFRGPNAWILAVAIIIASIGLNVNSIPVIIGVMLISPLMGPIFGLGLGLGINDIELMKKSGRNLLVMVSISVVVSLVYFQVTLAYMAMQ